MNKLSRYITILLLLVITKSGNAQDYNTYRGFDAVMLQVNGNTRTENKLKGAIITLPNNANQLNVSLSIPYHSINYKPADNAMFSSPGLSFKLKLNVDPWLIQEDLTSAKTFVAHGFLTLNDSTKAVMVEYMPTPAGPDQDGDFNLSMIIQFDPGDFNLDEQHQNSQFIIKISDAKVNRV